MLIIPPPKFRSRRGRNKSQAASPGPVALSLIGATYEPGTSVTMVFNQAINIAGINVSLVEVDDNVIEGGHYVGTGTAVLLNATTVKVLLVYTTDSEYSVIMLWAASGNGIVPVSGGAAWAGVSALPLPYP